MRSIWGSSPQDVYVVGQASDWFEKKMWHYNGQKWEDISWRYGQAVGGMGVQLFPFNPGAVFGFGPNDVWIVGGRDTSGVGSGGGDFILHFNGQAWTGTWLPNAYGHLALWGASPNDIWIGGGSGQLFHFNGIGWQESFLPDSVIINYIDGISSNEVYAEGISTPNNIVRTTYYRWNGTSWFLIESSLETDPDRKFGGFFTFSNNSMLSANWQSITRRISQGVWQEIFRDANANFGVIKAFGSSNIFAMGTDASGTELVYQYNGQNWSRLTAINNPQSYVSRAWTDGKEAFLIARELSSLNSLWPRRFVLRGK